MNTDVANLLHQWGLEGYIKVFQENFINSTAMSLLGPTEIKEIFPSIGHRVIFTKRLEEWRKLGQQKNNGYPVPIYNEDDSFSVSLHQEDDSNSVSLHQDDSSSVSTKLKLDSHNFIDIGKTVLRSGNEYVNETEKPRHAHSELIDNDERKLAQLLAEFELDCLLQQLKDKQITFRSLPFLLKEDIADAIPNIGLRAEFREKLFSWRKQQYGKDDETLSTNSKVEVWRKAYTNKDMSSQIKCSKINLSHLLNSSSKGKCLLQFYEKNKRLENVQRAGLVQLIIDEVNCNDLNLSPTDYPNIVEQIVSIFPTEKDVEDYYFIRRSGKRNPTGKLYSKYGNSRSKRFKIGENSNKPDEPPEPEHEEVDEPALLPLKIALSQDSLDWSLVLEKWKKTFSLRQKELKISKIDFFKSWPKFSDSKAPELINIDFNLMYPGKGHSMFGKWAEFKTKIKEYYKTNIHNESCKKQLILLKTSSKIPQDYEDYILASLLNTVLPPLSRVKDKNGGNKRKVTISDAQERFVLRIPTINNYEEKIQEIVNKYCNMSSTIQPFVIVVGADDTNLNSFYVHLDKNLYKFKSFVEALDTCFKTFQVLLLEYPLACQPCWVFIQKYFFGIDTQFDLKSPNITSLLSFLKQDN